MTGGGLCPTVIQPEEAPSPILTILEYTGLDAHKTNVMRILEAQAIPYRCMTYEVEEGNFDGNLVARKLGMDPDSVFKTLVCAGDKGSHIVFCIPVSQELDMKKAARAARHKRVEMLPLKELLPLTGYVRGGCSPIGMKKPFPTYIDETAQLFDEIAVSAGRRGEQIILAADSLCTLIGANYADLTVE